MGDLEKHPGMVGWWATCIPNQHGNMVYYDTPLHQQSVTGNYPVDGELPKTRPTLRPVKQPFIRFLVALVKQQHLKRTFAASTDEMLKMLIAFSKHNGLEIANTVTATVAMGMAFGAFKSAVRRSRVGSADRRSRGFVIHIAELKEELILTNQYGDYNDVLP
jgi:hypothetical protein